jgi:hypothetical protein
MKKTLKIYIYIFFTLFFTSCVTKYKIQENEFKFIPYKGNEILVFESNEKEVDTIGLKTFEGWYRTQKVPYRIFHNKYEKYGIELTHNASKITDSIPGFIIEISAFDWKGLRIDLRTKSTNFNYINQTRHTVSEFDSIPSIEMKVNELIYNDVKIILGEKPKNETENHIIQFYWSKKYGLLGWDNKNRKWRLRKNKASH